VSARDFVRGALLIAGMSAWLWAAAGAAQMFAQNAAPAEAQSSSATPKHKGAQPSSEGERVFEQNCSRCHNAPEGFSPRISATIVQHMRVRASLSRHDEQELLKYLNP
jgi:cytochrome c5